MDEILRTALEIIKKRENYWGNKAHTTDSYELKQNDLSMASAYHSAWWILYYAAIEDWECLKQYDYYKEA